jgi:hypothetical protein
MTTFEPDPADPEGRCQHCGQPPHLHDPFPECRGDLAAAG